MASLLRISARTAFIALAILTILVSLAPHASATVETALSGAKSPLLPGATGSNAPAATPATGTCEIYMKTFGSADDPAIVFIHGGPGYNCYLFEFSAAKALAEKGFFVVAYDQRGCGRTVATRAEYTFAEAMADLGSVMDTAKVMKAAFIGHSFGGAVALNFAEKYPEKVSAVILLGAPLDYPSGFKAILNNCRKVYSKKAPASIASIDMVEKLDHASLEYLNMCFMHAMACGLYSPAENGTEAVAIKNAMAKDAGRHLASKSEFLPVAGFLEKERYSTLDHTPLAKRVRQRTAVFGIYGSEDGLFDEKCLKGIEEVVGKENFALVTGASHNVFRDRRDLFCETVAGFLGKERKTNQAR